MADIKKNTNGEVSENNEMKQYVVFGLEQEEYGLDIQKVEIIERLTQYHITRVPKAPYFIRGVINLRGVIIPIMSLRMKFNLDVVDYTENTRIIIIKIEDNSIGMIVDEVKEVIQLSSEAVENVQGYSSDLNQNFISGVGKAEERIVTLLHLKNLIESTMEEIKETIN